MGPVFRLAWRRTYHPEIMDRAAYFFGWIDFLTFRMCGWAVIDQSTVSRYATYDLRTMDWSAERVVEHDIPEKWLPEVLPWGQ
jgi:sugar (pentulose or hexulose) kinase